MMRHYAPLMPSSVKSYSEPFFGGGAMLIKVMETHSPSLVRINDINKDIMGIYRAIRDDCPNFMKSMDLHQQRYIPLSKEDRKKLFYEIRHEHAWDHQKWSPTEQAATLYFLMKTAFNGIWQVNRNTNGRFGTPSGLLNQRDAVYDRDNVLAWSHMMGSTTCLITSEDWSSVPHGDFTFMDPPYRDSFADYDEAFPDSELLRLIDALRCSKTTWICNRDCGDGFFDGLGLEIHRFPVTYTAGRRKKTENGYEAKKATEVLLINR
jgi:DNA adenine methylase